MFHKPLMLIFYSEKRWEILLFLLTTVPQLRFRLGTIRAKKSGRIKENNLQLNYIILLFASHLFHIRVNVNLASDKTRIRTLENDF